MQINSRTHVRLHFKISRLDCKSLCLFAAQITEHLNFLHVVYLAAHQSNLKKVMNLE